MAISSTTTRATFGSILGTVTTTATAATNLIGTVSSVIDIGASYVDDFKTEQALRSKANKYHVANKVAISVAQELAQMDMQVEEFCQLSEKHAASYNAHYSNLTNLLKD